MRRVGTKASENRALVVAAASQMFRAHGFDAVALDTIMAAAGRSRGEFYKHFSSKEDLAAAAVAHGLLDSAARLAAQETLGAYVNDYLTPEHRDDPGTGCVVAALSADLARRATLVRAGLSGHVSHMLDGLTQRIGGADPLARQQAIAILSSLVGAMILARAVDEPALSDEILASARMALADGTATTGAKP